MTPSSVLASPANRRAFFCPSRAGRAAGGPMASHAVPVAAS